jgi:hypothetical protein
LESCVCNDVPEALLAKVWLNDVEPTEREVLVIANCTRRGDHSVLDVSDQESFGIGGVESLNVTCSWRPALALGPSPKLVGLFEGG